MAIQIGSSLDDIDWNEVVKDLVADDFSNGRPPSALRRSFEQSQHVAIARDDARVVGTARLLSDGVSNAYLLDVWTASTHRRRGIGLAMVEHLAEMVPGQHLGLQADRTEFYESMGFGHQPHFMSKVIGTWLANEANRG
jgi:GNAT superfamily N-acetyltransferase